MVLRNLLQLARAAETDDVHLVEFDLVSLLDTDTLGMEPFDTLQAF